MDKNTLVGFALIGAVVIGFSIYNRPSQEEMARAKHYQDSIQAIAQKEAERLAQAATAQSQNATLHLDSTSMFYGANQGTEQLTTLENNVVKLTFTNKGGRVCAAILKDYNGQDGKPLMLFDEKDSGMNFAFEGKNENIFDRGYVFPAYQRNRQHCNYAFGSKQWRLYRFRLQTFTGCLHGEFHYSRKRHAEFLPSCPEHSQYKLASTGTPA